MPIIYNISGPASVHGIVFLVFNQNRNYYFKMFLLYFIDILKSNICMYIEDKISFTKLLCVNLTQRYVSEQNENNKIMKNYIKRTSS